MSIGPVLDGSAYGRPIRMYPSPFFDIASQYMPRTIKETFAWCSFYQTTNSIISSVISKLACYPITRLVYQSDSDGIKSDWKRILDEHINLSRFLEEVNYDRYTYGNAFVTVGFPFQKSLICNSCEQKTPLEKCEYKFKDYRFILNCRKCGATGEAKAVDDYLKSIEKIKPVRINPSCVDLEYSPYTGAKRILYRPSQREINQLITGNQFILANTPQVVLDALRQKKPVEFLPSKVIHISRASASRLDTSSNSADPGWGSPLLLPVLKDAFLLSVLKKTQEIICFDHIVPWRVLHPLPMPNANPATNIDLRNWQVNVEEQYKKWRTDPGHVSVMPIPIGSETVGGQGRALLPHGEVRAMSEFIIAGMGVPVGFFYGEAMYSGANVNMRALENGFISDRDSMVRVAVFIMKSIAAYMGRPELDGIKFTPFRMADELARMNFEFQLVKESYISSEEFLEAYGFDTSVHYPLIDKEVERREALMKRAQLAATRIQIEAQKLMAEAQAQAQPVGQPMDAQAEVKQPPPEGSPDPNDPFTNGARIANELGQMPPELQRSALEDLSRSDPETFAVVSRKMSTPDPTLKPPRRGNGAGL